MKRCTLHGGPLDGATLECSADVHWIIAEVGGRFMERMEGEGLKFRSGERPVRHHLYQWNDSEYLGEDECYPEWYRYRGTVDVPLDEIRAELK